MMRQIGQQWLDEAEEAWKQEMLGLLDVLRGRIENGETTGFVLCADGPASYGVSMAGRFADTVMIGCLHKAIHNILTDAARHESEQPRERPN